jgi:undecaprenyl diphosphate synthase
MNKVPRHLAIVMDGNGRWAERQNKPRFFGHRAGAENIHRLGDIALKAGIEVVSLFVFSTENWNRPKEEVDYLMELFGELLKNQVHKLHEKNIQIHFVGDLSKFSSSLQQLMYKAKTLTQANTGLKLVLATNYGGRWDITQATRQIAQAVQQKEFSISEIDEKKVEKYLTLSDLPPIDFLIRTSGEMRISNFFLWQLAYSELYFTDILWPDFDEKAFEEALASYAGRKRRFGGLSRDSSSKEV